MPLLTVVETQEYLRRAEKAGLDAEERSAIINYLANDPEAGASLGGGLRKVRIARAGSGKSGGYRVLHFYRSSEMPLFLLTIFAKNEQANISKKEQAALIALCDLIAETYGVPR